ncbi:MAG: beta-1,6-N-acetylglucosaminyltransferase [Aeromicrobium sp.]
MPKVIAYAVLAHEDPDMIRRLVADLRGRPVVVHVDAKSDIEPFRQIPGIRLVENRVAVHWGGFSVVEATLHVYRAALEELGDEPDAAVVLLSGSDVLVRPVEEFEEYVNAVRWSEHIRAVPLIDGFQPLADRALRRWCFDLVPPRAEGWRQRRNAVIRRGLAVGLPRRRLAAFRPYTLAVSSQWTLLTRACLEDLLPIALDPAYRRLFRHTYAPDEMYFATLVHSSRWSARTEFGGLEERGERITTEFPNFHYVDPSLNVWLDETQAPKVAASGAFFARKIRSRDVDTFLRAVAEARSGAGEVPALRGVRVAAQSPRDDG